MWLERFWKRKQPAPAVAPEARALFERIEALAQAKEAAEEPGAAADTQRYLRQHQELMAIVAATKAAEPSALVELVRLALPAREAAEERRRVFEGEHGYHSSGSPGSGLLAILGDVFEAVLPKDLPWTRQDIDGLVAWWHSQKTGWQRARIARPLLRALQRMDLLADQALRAWVREAIELEEKGHKPDRKWTKLAREALGEAPVLTLPEGEPWSDALAADLDAMEEARREAWFALLMHASAAGGSTPTAKWRKEAAALAQAVGRAELVQRLTAWFALVDRPRETPIDIGPYQRFPAGSFGLTDVGQELLKGLCWCAAELDEPELARVLGRLALGAFRRVPGLGPRAVKVGNAALHALARTSGPDALAQLAMLRVKVKVRSADKTLEKALDIAAERAGLAREDVEELAVPSYGFSEVGARREELGDFRAELAIDVSGSTTLRYVKPDGRASKSVPAAVKAGHAEELAELKAAAKDAAAMLSAQRDRIDALFLEQKTWPLAAWRERYLDHPLTGVLARALLWSVTEAGGRARTVFLDAAHGLVGPRGEPVELVEPGAVVRLWHPIESSVDEVLAWRRFVEERGVRQPFKQAHREVYLLTEAERRTRTYSNRFAAHVLRQHQFNALCAARRWRNTLRMLVDDEYPPATRTLVRHGLRAEYWIEGAGAEHGRDTSESGALLHLVTDQVRFYRLDAAENRAHAGGGGYGAAGRRPASEPVPLEEVPPLVLSEVLRDVDLFVGVASVGNNPQWQDGGPENRFREYWWSYGFGELSESGAGRRELLERLIPRLSIAPACSFIERFLVVKGKLRTYKIHLGSGNILMEPNDQYLCIVPNSSAPAPGGIHLPFEGDRTLSIILSKAFLLAADEQIEDATILRQIRA